jgi:hypothetical protein
MGEVTFEFQASCGLRLTVVEKGSKRPVTGWFSVDVTDHESGELINGAAASNPFGEYELRDRLPPGRVDVRVRSRGYHEMVIRDIELTEPGRRTSVLAELTADETVGDLSITIPALAGVISSVSDAPPQPRVLIRPSGPDPGAWSFAPEVRLDPPGPTFRIGDLKEGSYDLVIAYIADRRVCVLRDIEVRRGDLTRVTADLRAGQDLPLRNRAGESQQIRVTRVSDSGLLDLPVYRVRGPEVTLYGPEDDVAAAVILGPYPEGALHLEVKQSPTASTSSGGPR